MTPSPLAVRLLAACCAHPQTQAEVEATLWRRGFPLALTEQALRRQLLALVEGGLLGQSGVGVRGGAYRYTLTPAGETMLDEMWGRV